MPTPGKETIGDWGSWSKGPPDAGVGVVPPTRTGARNTELKNVKVTVPYSSLSILAGREENQKALPFEGCT